MQHRMRVRRDPRADDLGFSMLATVLSLLGVAILTALLLGSTLKSGSSSSTNIDNAPGVAAADGLQAQQALSTGLTAADSAAASQGGYGSPAWYGAQTGRLASCTAPALASAPTPGPVSSSAVGWQQASFPAA